MKKILLTILLALLPNIAFGAITFPINGGTGSSTLNGILIGNGTSPVNTLKIGTNLTLIGTTLNATGGSGSSWATTSTDYWLTQQVIPASYGGTGQSTYSVGDILYATGASTLSKLGIGASTEVLTVNGGIPTWLPAPSTFSTTSANYWSSQGLGFSTTSTDYWLTIQGLLTSASAATTYVPYTGATGNVNLGNNQLLAPILSGHTDSSGLSIYADIASTANIKSTLTLSASDGGAAGGGDIIFKAGAGLDDTNRGKYRFGQPANASIGGLFNFDGLTLDNTYYFPNETGIVALTSGVKWATSSYDVNVIEPTGATTISVNVASTTNLYATSLVDGCLSASGGTGLIVSSGSPCASGGGSWATTSEAFFWSQNRDWNVTGTPKYLTPTSTIPVFISASTTIQNLSVTNSTTTFSTTTNGVFTNATTTTANIPRLSNLVTNGFVKTGGLIGTLSVDTATYLTANQTITLSGDCTGSGTTGITTLCAGFNRLAFATTYATTTNATTTPSWFKTALYASSTIVSPSVIDNLVSTNGTTTFATSTSLYGTKIGTNSEYFTDLTGSKLTNVGGVLTVTETDSVVGAVNGIVKSNGSASFSAAANGTDFSLITANTCGAGQHFNQATAGGVFSCTADTGGGSSIPNLVQESIGTPKYYTASTTETTNLSWYFKNGFVSTASSTISELTLSGTAIGCTGAANALKTSATGVVTCSAVTASASPGGVNTNVQFNDSSAMNGTNDFVFNKTAISVGIGTSTPFGRLDLAADNVAYNLILTDNGAGTNLKHWAFDTDGGYLYLAKMTDLGATSTVAEFTFDTQGHFGIGSTSPFAELGVNGNAIITNTTMLGGGQTASDAAKYVVNISTTTKNQFEIASSSQDILEVTATSTDYTGTQFGGTRVAIGTSTKAVPQDQLFVDGRINTGDWSYSACDSAALNRSVAQVTDAGLSLGTVATGFGCDKFGFDEAANGQASFVSTDSFVGGYTLLAPGATGAAGATVAGDGMGMRPFNSYLSFATNTPVLAARVRLTQVQFASTSIFTVGFGNYTISGTVGVGASGYNYPTLGCWLTASSSQANWIAVCTNGSNATTTVNTGVATSSVTTGTPNGRFQDLRIEVSSTTAKFYITTPGFTTASSSNPVATITTNIPLKTVITPVAAISVQRPAAAGQASALQLNRIRMWWQEPLQ